MHDCVETSPYIWQLELECPNCWLTQDISVTQQEADVYDLHLDACEASMNADLAVLTRENMEHDAILLATALACDGILPEDFS